MSPTLQDFLEACNILGMLRLIVTSSAGVLEVRSPLENLFYADLPQGRYGNMHTDGFEFHLNLDRIQRVKFETGSAKRGDFTTYAIRLIDDQGDNALSLFLQWGKPGEYAPGQVDAWETLRNQYGDIWEPTPLTKDP